MSQRSISVPVKYAVQPHFVKITSLGFNNNYSLNYSRYCLGPNLGHGRSVTYAWSGGDFKKIYRKASFQISGTAEWIEISLTSMYLKFSAIFHASRPLCWQYTFDFNVIVFMMQESIPVGCVPGLLPWEVLSKGGGGAVGGCGCETVI